MPDRTCPHCKSTNLKRNGRDRHGRQRLTCKDCGKSHYEGNDPTNTGGRPKDPEVTAIAQEFGISRKAASMRLARAKQREEELK